MVPQLASMQPGWWCLTVLAVAACRRSCCSRRTAAQTVPLTSMLRPCCCCCSYVSLHLCHTLPLQLLFKEDCSVDDLIDVIEGNRRYVKCLYVYNKVRQTRAWILQRQLAPFTQRACCSSSPCCTHSTTSVLAASSRAQLSLCVMLCCFSVYSAGFVDQPWRVLTLLSHAVT